MKTEPKFPVTLQINSRTRIKVKTMEAYNMWMERHPEAVIVSPTPSHSEETEATPRYTFDKQEMTGQPVLFILRDGERFMGSIHCSTHCIEDIVDELNKSHNSYATLKRERDNAIKAKEEYFAESVNRKNTIEGLQADNEAKDMRIKDLVAMLKSKDQRPVVDPAIDEKSNE